MSHYIIVGGTRGIGQAVVERLTAAGNTCTVLARSVPAASLNPKVQYVAADVTQPLPDMALPESMEGVVYCPGTANLLPFHRISRGQFAEDFSINVLGAVSVLQWLLPALKKGGHPSVVLFSSVAAGTGMNFHASVAASKGAVEGLTRSLAAEWAPTIRVNCLAPSLVKTTLTEKLTATPEKTEQAAARHPLQRIGSAEDIAEAVCFLLSPQSAWITGQVLGIDGGLSAIKK